MMGTWKKIDPGWKWDDTFIFSQAIQAGNTIYLAGQVALDPDGKVVGKGDMKAQTRQAWENIKAILEAAGASLNDVVKVTQFITDMSCFIDTQEVRKEYFKDYAPASTSVEVKSLAFPDLLIEIEVVAVKPS
jgi:2-iminobutanoate/2-iminopropanoate deaminase